MEMRLEKGHGTFSGNSTGHFGKLEGQRMLKKLVSLIPLRGARGPLRLTLLIETMMQCSPGQDSDFGYNLSLG